MSAVADSSMTSGDYVQDLASPHAQVLKDGSSPVACLRRMWFSIRWKLSRTIFSRPLPFLTATLDLQLGDILVTLPVAALALAVNANLCAKEEVKESGSLPMIAMIVTFALAIRNNSILLTLTGLPFKRVLFYHKFVGVVAILLTGLHGLAYLLEDAGVTAARRLRGGGDGKLMKQQEPGAICFYLLCALLVFSLAPIRRRFYEGFLRIHWLLFIGIVVFAVIHGAGGVVVGFIPWVLGPAWISGSEELPRGVHQHFTLQEGWGYLSGTSFNEPFIWRYRQYVFICIPSISLLEWHPFTISSSPSEILVTIHIKSLGDWSKKLLTKIPVDSVVKAQIPILVDGPYVEELELLQCNRSLTSSSSTSNIVVENSRKWSVRERAMVEAMMNADFVEERKLLQGQTPAYLPDDLTSAGPNGGTTTPGDVFKAEFYLTQCQPDPENPIDSRLQHCMRYNTRPDIEDILKTLGQNAAIDGKQRVAVLVCGPSTLTRDVINISMKLQRSSKINYDVHTECFEF